MMLSSTLVLFGTGIFFNSLIGNCHGYGLLKPFEDATNFGYVNSSFFEMKSGYWLYSCLYSPGCREIERGRANHFGYGAEWYYDTCDYDGGIPDRPIRCKRIVDPYPHYPHDPRVPPTVPPIAPINKFIDPKKESDIRKICAECAPYILPVEGFTNLFYIKCECPHDCWGLDLANAEARIFWFNTTEFNCMNSGTVQVRCKCILKSANWSSTDINCVPPIYNCASPQGEIL